MPMTLSCLRPLALAAVLATLVSPSIAQDERASLAQSIARAQGLPAMFEIQLAQQRQAMRGYAEQLSAEMGAQGGGEVSAREKVALERFMEKASKLFTADEMLARWTENYGKSMSIDELRAIHTYYESAVGRADVEASKSAMVTFSGWMNDEALARTTKLVGDLGSELQESK